MVFLSTIMSCEPSVAIATVYFCHLSLFMVVMLQEVILKERNDKSALLEGPVMDPLHRRCRCVCVGFSAALAPQLKGCCLESTQHGNTKQCAPLVATLATVRT